MMLNEILLPYIIMPRSYLHKLYKTCDETTSAAVIMSNIVTIIQTDISLLYHITDLQLNTYLSGVTSWPATQHICLVQRKSPTCPRNDKLIRLAPKYIRPSLHPLQWFLIKKLQL